MSDPHQNHLGPPPSEASPQPPPSSAPSRPVPASPYPSATPAPAQQAEQLLFTVGDIGVSRSWVVTPNGSAPLGGSQWIGRDMSRTETTTPSWAIVMAILLFLACFLGLLFLLVKEERTTGYFEVSVQSGNLHHVTQLPVSSQAQVVQYRQAVHQAQTMSSAVR